jgi:ABC-type sugar transport system substrate-binding protein
LDYEDRGRLVQEARAFAEQSRREFLGNLLSAGAVGTLAGGLVGSASADEIEVAQGGRKVRVGIPLNYGPLNQPWRRGCWQMVKTVSEKGGEPVTLRGVPSKASEQEVMLELLDRDIDALVVGLYSLENDTAHIVDKARDLGIKTVGFGVDVKDSPAVVEDTWATAMTLGYYLHNVLDRRGTIVQTAENKGFYTPFDMEADMLDLMTGYEPKMSVLPFMAGSVSTKDQIGKGRENMSALLAANPEPESVSALVSWWWPLSIGAGQAMKLAGRNDVRILNHYFSIDLLKAMAAQTYPIEFSTDVPWHTIGRKCAELAMAMGRGETVPNHTFRAPVTAILPEEAERALRHIEEMDLQAIALLKPHGG